MMAQLTLVAPDKPPVSYRISGEKASVGRHPENTVVLACDTVSTHHAVLERADGTYRLRDLGSANGTFQNGSRIQEALLNGGDILMFGDVSALFSTADQTAPLSEEVVVSKRLILRTVFAAAWLYLGFHLGGVAAHFLLRAITQNWEPDFPEWFSRGALVGGWVTTLLLLLAASFGKLPGTRPPKQPKVETIPWVPKIVAQGAGVLALVIACFLAKTFHSVSTTTRTAQLDKLQKRIAGDFGEMLKSQGQQIVTSLHSGAMFKDLVVHDVSFLKTPESPFVIAISSSVYWALPEAKNGFTEMTICVTDTKLLSANVVSTNGEVRDGWSTTLPAAIGVALRRSLISTPAPANVAIPNATPHENADSEFIKREIPRMSKENNYGMGFHATPDPNPPSTQESKPGYLPNGMPRMGSNPDGSTKRPIHF